MSYINRGTNVVVEYSELQAIYPNSSIPADGVSEILEYSYVFGSTIPTYDINTEKLTELTPVKAGDDKYYRTYQVVALSQPEIDTLLATNIENAQNSVDSSCRAFIYASWSAESQSNVAIGLYEQAIADLCKNEIGSALSENVGFVADIGGLSTKEAIDAYVAAIVRTPISGGQ